MVVYEIKNPVSVPPELKKQERSTEPIQAIDSVARINQFRQIWERRKNREGREESGLPVPIEAENEVRRLINKLNHDLERHGIMLHLTLASKEGGLALDIYDCSDLHSCTIVGELFISTDELPGFILSLQQETGIMVNRMS